MTTYAYKCPNCEDVIEDLHPRARIKCHCKGIHSPYFKRMYVFGGVSFKGSGFYKTDKDA